MAKGGSGSAVSLDTVMINIESNAGKSAGNIRALSDSLGQLKNNIKGGFININKLSNALETLVPTLNKLKNASKNIKVLDELAVGLSQLKDIGKPGGLIQGIASLEKLPGLMEKMDAKTFENLKRVSNELAQSLTPLADKMQAVANGYSAFSKIQNTFGKSASTVTRYTKQQRNMLSSLGSVINKGVNGVIKFGKGLAEAFGKKSLSNIKSFHSKFKQVYLSLLGTRTLFTLIRKGASEYMNFDQTLQKFATNIWRAFGAQLAPVIEYAMELFKQFVRVVYSVIYAITGIDLIARANKKAMDGWSKSAKDTLGNLQKFDDLNVVEFPKGDEDKELITMDKIDLSPIQKVIDWVRKLKQEIIDAWNSGEWYGVGKVLAEGINMGTSAILNNIDNIRDKFLEIGKDIGDMLNGVIENMNWTNLGKSLGEAFTLLPDFITQLISTIKWKNLGEGIRAAIMGVKWKKVWSSITNLAKEAFKGLKEFIDGLLDLDTGEKFAIKSALVGIGVALVTYKIAEGIVNIGLGLKTLGESVTGLKSIPGILGNISSTLKGPKENPLLNGAILDMDNANDLVKYGGLMGQLKGKVLDLGDAFSLLSKKTLTTESIAGITGVSSGLVKAMAPLSGLFTQMTTLFGGSAFAGTIATIGIVIGAVVVTVLALVEGFKELWNESEEFRNSVTELGSLIGDTFNIILDTLKQVIEQTIETFKSFYEKALKPVFDLLVEIGKPIIEAVIDILNILFKNVIKPLASFLKEVFLVVWDFVLIAVEALGLVLAPVIDALEWLWKKVLSPIVTFLLDSFVGAFDQLTGKFKGLVTTLRNLFGSVRTFLDDTLAAMRGGWGSFWNYLKDLINKMIGGFERFINSIVDGINGLSKGLRKIGNKIFDIIGVDVKFEPISKVSIPKLATGTNEIPNEGLYHLHPGEAVVPKKYNPALGNGGSEEMNAKLDTLIDIMNNMNFTNVVNIGNKKVYEGQQAFNKTQQNKYGTINLY